ncbi:transcription termination/antitermination NusG family protein, partial [Bariatricus sp. HCP28S3_B10]
MWYVVQVSTGAEERIRLQCEKKIDKSIMEECFIPQYEEKKHFRGKWTVQKKILFPG